MLTFSDSETSTGAMSVISLPESEDFEIILMPSLSPSTSTGVRSLEASMSSLGIGTSNAASGAAVEQGGVAASCPAAGTGGSSPAGAGGAIPTSHPSEGDDDGEGEDGEGDSDASSSAHTHRPSGATSRPTHTASILSASDARESINSFLTDPDFTSDKANKLRLWQAICIEDADDLSLDSLSSYSDRGLTNRLNSSDEDSASDNTPTASRSTTPTPTLPPLPTSLKAADRLLQTRAHVNILEYLEARNDPSRHNEDIVGKYADLVYPSTSALLRAMRRDRKYAKTDDVKREWLQPLLKDFGFRRRREGPA